MSCDCVCEKTTDLDYLYVIAVISNPIGYERRYQLFDEFCERMKLEPQVKLISVEAQNGCKPFKTNATLKYRTNDEIWLKENLINLGIQSIPEDWRYVSWIDTDIEFQNREWVRDTIEQLQTYSVVQMFNHAIDLGPNGEALQTHIGFMYGYINEGGIKKDSYSGYRHSGYCWSATRGAINAMGGLVDWAIFGSADLIMASALIGQVEKSLRHDMHPNFILLCKLFEERCESKIKRNVSYVKGTILHNFHGCKSKRQYHNRPKVLADLKFDPIRDLSKNWQGLLQLENYNIKLRDEIRYYFRSRNDNSIDLFQDYRYYKKDWL